MDEGIDAMTTQVQPEPDERGVILYVGQDAAGHWLVQDNARRMEGRFVSLSAALGFAEAERQMVHGQVERVATPLVPVIPFGPVPADVMAVRHAA